MIRYLSVEQVVSLHQQVIGHLTDAGVQDFRALERAVGRPATTFETEDLYPTLDAKAAALLMVWRPPHRSPRVVVKRHSSPLNASSSQTVPRCTPPIAIWSASPMPSP